MPKPVDVSTPSDREIRVARAFDAPARLVWDCHTKPELIRRWMLGPPGWSMPVCEVDLTVGGAYRYRWRKRRFSREQKSHDGKRRARTSRQNCSPHPTPHGYNPTPALVAV